MIKKQYTREEFLDVIFLKDSLDKRHYTFDVKSKVTMKALKAVIESYFDVTVASMKSHPVQRKGKKREHILEHGKDPKYKRLIATLRPGDSISDILPGEGIVMDSAIKVIYYNRSSNIIQKKRLIQMVRKTTKVILMLRKEKKLIQSQKKRLIQSQNKRLIQSINKRLIQKFQKNKSKYLRAW